MHFYVPSKILASGFLWNINCTVHNKFLPGHTNQIINFFKLMIQYFFTRSNFNRTLLLISCYLMHGSYVAYIFNNTMFIKMFIKTFKIKPKQTALVDFTKHFTHYKFNY